MKACFVLFTLAIFVIACQADHLDDLKKSCDASKGEEFNTCYSACPDTCANHKTVRPCTMQCIIGCGCPHGTVRRESDGHCVKPEEC
uniref:TIL domain-containing protein n=1 Tax=Parasteatoda tepidariorum TaxID=114398 RepID=A0A2L2Y504_PARTP|nr:chymotrypsin inhibitor [Parasteatoda tepidariorum]